MQNNKEKAEQVYEKCLFGEKYKKLLPVNIKKGNYYCRFDWNESIIFAGGKTG
jgi:hypothetical protein